MGPLRHAATRQSPPGSTISGAYRRGHREQHLAWTGPWSSSVLQNDGLHIGLACRFYNDALGGDPSRWLSVLNT
jgi:hypothetical protein